MKVLRTLHQTVCKKCEFLERFEAIASVGGSTLVCFVLVLVGWRFPGTFDCHGSWHEDSECRNWRL